MEPTNVITEKVYCHDCGGYDRGNDAAWLMMANNQNQWGNNPFAYAFLMGMMRFMYGDNWQNQYNGNAEMQARFNQLSNQMSDNHNTDILADLARGNYARIGELATNMGVDLRAIQTGICDARSQIQTVDGDVKAGFQGLQGDVRFTGERIINSNILGMKDMQAAFQNCCCENRLAQKDTLIAMKDQTYTLNERLTGIANGLQKGFSDLGYILSQNKGEIMLNQDRNTQRVLDQMCANTQQSLRDALAAKDRELLAANIIAGVKRNGCDCGCGAS